MRRESTLRTSEYARLKEEHDLIVEIPETEQPKDGRSESEQLAT